MSIPGTEGILRDFSTSGDLISDEIIAVPATSPYTVYPEFTPQKATPSSVAIWTSANKTGTQYTEKTSESLMSASGDFFVNYGRGGLMTFHSSAAGLSFFGTYNEIGTFMRVKQMNDMRVTIGSGDIVDRNGNNNLVTHANDFSIHLVSTSDIINISRHSGDPGAHPDYAYKPGRSGGQILKGGINANENLTLQSTADATRGKILLGSGGSAYDEFNTRIGIGTQNPATIGHFSGDAASEVRAESSSSWAGFSIKPQGMADSDIVYLWSDANEKRLRVNAGGSTRAQFFSPDAMIDVSGDARFLNGIKFVGSNPSIIRMSGDLAFFPNTQIGIETSNPVAKLDVSGDVHFSNDIGFSGLPTIIRSSGDINIIPSGTKGIAIGTTVAPTRLMEVSGDTIIGKGGRGVAFFDTVNSRVGIGTLTPLAPLHTATPKVGAGTGGMRFEISDGTGSANDYLTFQFFMRNATPTTQLAGDIRSYIVDPAEGHYGIQFVTVNSGIEGTRLTIDNLGNVGFNTTPTISDGTGIHVSGKIIRIGTSKTPASAGDTGNPFEICVDANYLYVCVATNSWKRVALSTW